MWLGSGRSGGVDSNSVRAAQAGSCSSSGCCFESQSGVTVFTACRDNRVRVRGRVYDPMMGSGAELSYAVLC